MHSEWTQNLHTFINPVNTRTPTSKLPTRGGHTLVTLSSMLLTRPERPKPLSKQKKGPPERHPWKGPPLGNPWFCWKNQPFSFDINAITSQCDPWAIFYIVMKHLRIPLFIMLNSTSVVTLFFSFWVGYLVSRADLMRFFYNSIVQFIAGITQISIPNWIRTGT